MNPYNPAAPSVLALTTGAILLILAGVALWRTTKGDTVNTYVRNAIFFAIIGADSLAAGCNIILMDIRLDEGIYGDPYTVPNPALIIGSLVLFVSTVCMAIDAIKRRRAVQTAGAITGIFATGTVASYVIAMWFLRVAEEWFLVTTAGWYLTVISLIVTIAIAVVEAIKMYGARKFEEGAEFARGIALDLATTKS